MKDMVTIDHVSKSVFVKGQEKVIVSDLSFNIKQGEIVGYIGPNGAGKSTTIKILCGIIEPSEGSVCVCDIVPSKNRIQNGYNIGVVFGQRTQLWWDLPLEDSFDVIKHIYKIDAVEFNERLNYLSDIFEISHLMKSTVRTLSLGERMKADIIAALLHNPPVLFLDEPTIGLDFRSKHRMREAILNINRKYNTTIILTTHDFSDIEELCNRIILLNRGKIIFDGSMKAVDKQFREGRFIEFSSNDELKRLLKSEYEVKEIDRDRFEIYICNEPQKINAVLSLALERFPKTQFLVKEPSLENTIERILQQ